MLRTFVANKPVFSHNMMWYESLNRSLIKLKVKCYNKSCNELELWITHIFLATLIPVHFNLARMMVLKLLGDRLYSTSVIIEQDEQIR